MREIYDENQQKLAHLLKSDFYQKLKQQLSQSEAPTLRQLKAVLGDGIDKDLDFLVDQKIVKRSDRRYALNLAVHPLTREKERIDQALQMISDDYAQSKTAIMLQLILLLQSAADEIYCIQEDQPFAFYHEVSNQYLKIVSISQNEWAFTLPNYFAYQKVEDDVPTFAEMESLLGDVDPDYYLAQVSLLLDRSGKLPKKNNIFLTSLKKFRLLKDHPTIEINAPYLGLDLLEKQPDVLAPLRLNDFERRVVASCILRQFNVKQQTVIFTV